MQQYEKSLNYFIRFSLVPMVLEQDALSRVLAVLTDTRNLADRRALAHLSFGQREMFRLAFPGSVKALGMDSSEIDGQLGLLLTIRLIWRLVPRRLFQGLDPDYERLANGALIQMFSLSASSEMVRRLAVIFRRIRSSRLDGRKTTSLDLESIKHKELMDTQNGRCAVCAHKFTDSDLFSSDEADAGYSREAYEPLEGEISLSNYYRKPVLDHILPYFLGGDGPENWQILCFSCNAGKGEAISWVSRKGWMPPTRISDVLTLTPALRYSALARHRASVTEEEPKPGQVRRIFLADPQRMVLLDNLKVELL